MDRTQLCEILRVGLKSASPYNSQPWEFEFKENRLFVYAKYVERGFLGNFQNVILYSLGTLLENLAEGAKHFKFEMTYRLLNPTVQMKSPLCEVFFTHAPHMPDYDIKHVISRYTNRKTYKKEPVPASVVEKISGIFRGNNRAIINVTNNHEFIRTCAELEKVRLTNIEFSEDLISNLCFSAKEAQERRRGLDLRVLELSFSEQLFLRASRSWFFRKTVGRSFIVEFGARSSKKRSLYGCPLLLAFKESDESAETMIQDWKDIQRILNLIHREGLSSQLIASSPDLTKIKRAFYPPAERKILDKADQDIQKIIGVPMQSILTLLRVGYADECPIKSLRVDPQEILRA